MQYFFFFFFSDTFENFLIWILVLDNKKIDSSRYVSLNSLSSPISFLLPISQSQS